RSRAEERRKGKPLDQSLIRKPYLELAHFSMEKPAQFHAKTNNRRPKEGNCVRYVKYLQVLATRISEVGK
ncbi:hypothetical protein, partial [Agrobacterium vitis]|uniref:hypothetical protein n=1 Tax=Agrobacterium vitis TaxID=373 RepID=UPI001AEEE755